MKFLLFLLPAIVFANIHLKDGLAEAEAGDYFVTKQSKTATVMLIKSKNPLTLCEISTPNVKDNFRAWIENGAKGHTSWIEYQIDNGGNIVNLHSKTNSCDLKTSQNFLSTLLNLTFEEVPPNERKMKGQSKKEPWQPQMTWNGAIVKDARFTPYRATWPNDGSDLKGKEILIYLPQDQKSYFPHWIQVSGQLEKAKLRVLDAGKKLSLPTQS